MSTDWGMDKEDVVYVCVCVCVCVCARARTLEYYSAIKKNETKNKEWNMLFATIWMG